MAIAFYLVFVASNPIGGVSLWLVLYPFTETTVNISLGEGIPDLSPTRFVVAFLTAILLGQAATGQRRFPKITWLDVACFLFVIGVGISAITSYDPVGAFQSVLDLFLIPVLAYYAVKNLVRNEKELNIVFNTVLIIAFYSCFFVFNEWITGTVLLYDGDAATIYADSGIRILRSLWGGPHVFGTIFGFAVPLTFYKLAKSDNAFSKVFYTLLLMLFLAALVLTFKRAAWVSTLVSFIIIFPFFPAFRKIFVIGLIILAIPLAVFWQQLSSVEGVEQRVTGRVDTLNGRTYRWEAAIDLWKEKPITGWGFKNFDTVSQYGAVENFYLHILVSGGLLAFIPFLAITILTIYGSLQIYIRGPSLPNVFVNRELVAIFWGLFATWLVKAMTGAQAVAIINILLFVIIGAMIGSQGEQLSLYKNKSSQAREP
ncbi:MAG: O-antigen ligase family protein [Anaerolineae bacterium]|nr:O-antigen ligase family protein [Anaerolineae bacterium]